MNISDSIFLAGHKGMVGSAIHEKLISDGYENIIIASKKELDLTNQLDVESFFNETKPAYVFLAAARVGGILANDSFSGEFIYQNMMIQNNVINSAYKNETKKLLFLGSSCIYPKEPEIPIKEDSLLTGKLESTNKAYAIAKIAGIEMCQSYKKQYGFNSISIMPTNLYGPNDNFSFENSHVLAALIRKFHDAKTNNQNSVICWGDGSPYREFLHVKDLANAAVMLMKHYESEQIINIGTGDDIMIKDLSILISKIVDFKGEIIWDESKPNGTPRKLLDSTRINELGWKPKISLEEGIQDTYLWFQENVENLRI
ncbi:GDP-L-fucose synthase [Candidatus Actinomarina]|nr:GDP-L-fucose synthase [Candidatus Actinomarina sp.]|tara:strand:+ start:848 stop:1789 length:942 start_codon:yes stop_codon:yes gene_type:complete